MRSLVLFLLLLSVGCTATRPLRLGISGDYPPFCTVEDNSWLGYTGLDLLLAERFAADLDLAPIQAMPFRWPELAPRLRANEIDAALCGVTIRGDRALSMAFTRPYAVSGAVVVRLPENQGRLANIEELEVLNDPRVRLAVNAGGHLERVTRRRFPKATLVTTTDNLQLRQILDRGDVDAVVSEKFEASTWNGVVVSAPFTHDRKAFAVSLEQIALRDRLNQWLAEREADGWLDRQRRAVGEFARLTPQQACYEAIAAVVDLRFSLMPSIAAVKRRDGLAISDPTQEAAVLERSRSDAAALGLPVDGAAKLFSLLIELAKQVQEKSTQSAAPDLHLAQLRAALSAASSPLLPEVARCKTWLRTAEHFKVLQTVLRQDVAAHGLDEAAANRLVTALMAAASSS